ncbi:MAG TPA: C4-type zinc ribbon domain-containing protein [Ilumatobacteraceae bacterium]|jgi:uncharacterized protein|nr:C4-type zinc ribbon domain-containing protein [Ilumatobacteraceae bacterium]
MTDPDDAPTSSGTPTADDTALTVPELLLALQAVDTDADQLAHRRANSELRSQFASASAAAKQWEQRRDELQRRIAELGATIESAEQRGAELLTHRQRLDQQLKTVIAPREAEALMHEIATIQSQRDELDDAELEALEEQSAADDELTAHLADEASVRDTAGDAADALAAETAEIDEQLTRLDARRTELRATLSDSLLSTYDRKRAALGVAVARLVGKQCQGCHLELSAAEIDTVKDEAAATGVTDCPDCGRLLIV